MARNRMIKPEFWTSKTISKLSYEARLLFIGLWNFSDDYGVSLYNTRKILGDIFPHESKINESKIKDYLQELMTQGLIYPVSYNESNYIIISSWKEHQIVPNPNKRRWLDKEIQENLESNESLIRNKLDSKFPNGKGKGEGKNKEKDMEFDIFCDFCFSEWNKLSLQVPVFPKLISISGSRKDHLKARYAQPTFRDIEKVLYALSRLPFYRGENDRKWVATFDWLIENDNNHIKILEKYKGD